MRWQSGEKASNPQTNTVTATMRGVTSHRASGRKWAGEVSVWKWPELCVGTVVLLSKQRWGRMGCLVVGMSQAATEWNVLSIDIWFTTNQKKKKAKKKRNCKKTEGGNKPGTPGREGWLGFGFEFRSHCQSFCSDFTVALRKNSSVRGDSLLLLFVSFHFISFQFVCGLCVPYSLSLSISIIFPTSPHLFPFPSSAAVSLSWRINLP